MGREFWFIVVRGVQGATTHYHFPSDWRGAFIIWIFSHWNSRCLPIPRLVGCLTTAWFIIESEIHLRQDQTNQNSHPLRSPVFHFLRPNQDYGRRMRVSCEGFYSSLSFSCWLVTYIIGRALTLKKIYVIFRLITHGEPAFTSYTVCFFYWLSVPSKCRSGTRLLFWVDDQEAQKFVD